MPYPQDLVGKYVEFRLDPGGTITNGAPLVDGVLPGQTIPATGKPVFLGHPGGPTGAIHVQPANPPWSFLFLKFIAGAVTTCPLAGSVMTGPMSGCYLCKYTRGGQQHLAHIGTYNNADSKESIAVKEAWRTFVARPDVSAVSGGSPFDYFSTSEQRTAMFKLNRTEVVGYFDGGAAHAILLARIPGNINSLGRDLWRVAAVKPMTLQPWSSIAAMRRFRA
jgi:hypothetical protein